MRPRQLTTQKKTTFHLDCDAFELFENDVREIGLRRDQYVNVHLKDAVKILEHQVPPLDAPSRARLKFLRDLMKPLLKKVSFRLEVDAIQEMNRVCKEKGVPRDAFFEMFIRKLQAAVSTAHIVLYSNALDDELAIGVDELGDFRAFATDDGQQWLEVQIMTRVRAGKPEQGEPS
jgi:hypothetical protein